MTTPEPDIPESSLVPPDLSDPLAMAQYLGASMIRLTSELKDTREASEQRDAKLDKYARRSRLYIALDVLVTVIATAATVVAVHALGSASSANSHAASADASAAAATAAEQALHSAQVSGCESGNQSRAGELAVWDYLLKASKPTSAKQAAQLAAFDQFLKATFAPRDCAVVYALKPQPKETDGAR